MEEVVIAMNNLLQEVKRTIIPALIFLLGMVTSHIIYQRWYDCGPCQYQWYSGAVSGATFFLTGCAVVVDQIYWSQKKLGTKGLINRPLLTAFLFIVGGLIFLAFSIATLISGCNNVRWGC